MEFLKLSGMRATIANNGKETLDRLAEQDFDAVLMDVRMPVMNGFMAAKKIRENPCFGTLPILALTAGVNRNVTIAC